MALSSLVLSRTPSGTVYEGGVLTLNMTWHNSSNDINLSQLIEVTWGDGAIEAYIVPATPWLPISHDFARSFTHSYPTEGSVSIIVRISCSGAAAISKSITFAVTNVAPSILSVSGDLGSDKVVDVTYAFSDPGAAIFDVYHITLSWGDGTSSSYVKSAAGTYTSSHTYSSTSVKHLITLTIIDADGASISQSFYPITTYHDVIDDNGSSVFDAYAIISYYDSIDDSGATDIVVDGIPFYDFTASGYTSSLVSELAVVDFTSVFIINEVECSKVGTIPFEQLIPPS